MQAANTGSAVNGEENVIYLDDGTNRIVVDMSSLMDEVESSGGNRVPAESTSSRYC